MSEQANETELAQSDSDSQNAAGFDRNEAILKLLNVAVAQMKNSMSDADEAINGLTETFTDMMQHVGEIKALSSTPLSEDLSGEIQTNVDSVMNKLQQAVMCFQFYDRLSQRLDHVSRGLNNTSRLLADSGNTNNPRAWSDLNDALRETFTVETDKVMFDAILHGATIDEAVELAKGHHIAAAQNESEIELF